MWNGLYLLRFSGIIFLSNDERKIDMLSFVSSINLGKIINILLEPSVTLTLGIFTLLISRNSNLSTVARERLDKVYHPLFLEIEPFLYKKVSLDDISPFLSKYYELENSHSLLIDPVLRQEIRWLEKPSALQENKYGYNQWFRICDQISKTYDKLCKQAHIPVRSISYRINYEQYHSKIRMIFACIWIELPAIAFFSLILGFLSTRLLIVAYMLFLLFLLKIFLDNL
jgi:hypothetical protein|nr:MAG TPA: hypothetical protein [Caudoviricetes sp.]